MAKVLFKLIFITVEIYGEKKTGNCYVQGTYIKSFSPYNKKKSRERILEG